VLYSSNPLQRGIVHKLGPANCPTRETFVVKEEFCDDWTAWAQDSKSKGYTTQQIFALIFNVLVFIAMGVGAYLALAAILRLYDIELKNVSAGLGKITAVVFKSLRQKAGEMKSGLGGLGALAALSKGKITPEQLAKIEQANPAALAPEQIAKIQQANPDTSIADAKAAEEAEKTAKAAEDERKKTEEAAEQKRKEDEAKAEKVEADKKKRNEQLAKVASDTKQRNEANAVKAAVEKTAKENASNALKAAEEAAKQKKADTEAKAAEEAKSAATTPKQSALEALRNRTGTIGKLSPEGQAQSGLLKTPGLGRGRTKPGRGRVGSTRRAGY
jgi:TolA protein